MTGEIRKMKAHWEEGTDIAYTLPLYDTASQIESLIDVNELIGQEISLIFNGEIICRGCAKTTKRSFMNGYCYNCFVAVPEASECVLRPELCRGHLGEGRDVEWEQANHVQPHYVYLAATDVVKVGVTRATQIPTRWIDQGASAAICLAKTPNRYTAGVLEVALKSMFTDKTNWRKMLKNDVDNSIDLVETKWELEGALPRDLVEFITDDEEVTELNYPVLNYPDKVKSLSFDKTNRIVGKLLGIKGQYLLFDQDRVINMRKHIGYKIQLITLQ